MDHASKLTHIKEFVGRTIVVRAPGTNLRLAHLFAPQSRFTLARDFTEMFRAICGGHADGTLMWERQGRSVDVELPPECSGHSFRYIAIPNSYVYSGIAAPIGNRPAQRAAAEIRKEMSKLAGNGAVSGIYLSWVNQSVNDILVIDLLQDARIRNLWLWLAVAAVVAIAGLVAWQNRRLRAARRAAEEARDQATRATAVKSEFFGQHEP